MSPRAVLIAVLLPVALIGCAAPPISAPSVPPVTHSRPPVIDPAPPEPPPDARLTVLKKRIAVARLGDTSTVEGSPFASDEDVIRISIEDKRGSDALTAMLVDELHQTDRFIVIERQDINGILRELSFHETKWVDKERSAKAGELLGAQIIITGALGRNEDRATAPIAPLGLYLRMYDVASSRIVASTRAIGRDRPEVMRNAIGQIVNQMLPVPWFGRIAKIDGDRIYINAGADTGIKVGDRFRVFTLGAEIRNPDDNTIIGYQQEALGLVEVTGVDRQVSTCRPIGSAKDIKRGDRVGPAATGK